MTTTDAIRIEAPAPRIADKNAIAEFNAIKRRADICVMMAMSTAVDLYTGVSADPDQDRHQLVAFLEAAYKHLTDAGALCRLCHDQEAAEACEASGLLMLERAARVEAM